MNYTVQRGLRELYTEHTLNEEEWNEIIVHFGNKCSYCNVEDTGNSRTGIIPDHLIPAANNGDYILGNIIPACQDCNDTRGKKDWKEYIIKYFPKNSDERVLKIERYITQFNYEPAIPEKRLENDEYQEYQSILNEWESLLKRATELRSKIQYRKNNIN